MQKKCGIIKLSLHKPIYLAFHDTLYISKCTIFFYWL